MANAFVAFFDTIAGRYALSFAVLVIVGVVVIVGLMEVAVYLLDSLFEPIATVEMIENELAFQAGKPFDAILLRKHWTLIDEYDRWMRVVDLLCFIVVCLLYACVASVWAYSRSRSIAQPLTALAEKSTEIARGELGGDIPVDQSAPIEARRLLENFNHLTKQLNAMEIDLQYAMSSIAHEMRTPLTIVRGYLTGAKDGVITLNDVILDRALSSVEGLERIILDLDTLSRLERAELAFQFDDIDATDVVRSVVEEYRLSGMLIELVDTNQPIIVRGDYVRIKQIVSNIIENARRYVGADKPVSVEVTKEDKHVKILVTDTGPGFDQAALINATRAFWRGDSARVGESGSGLGLSISRALAQGHGGDLLLDNLPTGGASVTVLLPH